MDDDNRAAWKDSVEVTEWYVGRDAISCALPAVEMTVGMNRPGLMGLNPS